MQIILPLAINALFLKNSEQVLGQDYLFENLPKTVGPIGGNPQNMGVNSGVSIVPRPFSYDSTVNLGAGLHLHFVLPEEYRRFNDAGELPQAPNRWFVRREASQEVKMREWIIESDYLWTDGDPELNKQATCTFLLQGDDGAMGFSYVGRTYGYREWLSREQEAANGGGYLEELTALGWGSLSFNEQYANCRSVFGLYDSSIIRGRVQYTIIGWRNDQTDGDLVAGRFSVDTSVDHTPDVSMGDFEISLGNTVPEAISAMILSEGSDIVSNPSERLRQEERIEAILNRDYLNQGRLDWVSRLRSHRHLGQFRTTGGTSKWSIVDSGVNRKLKGHLSEFHSTMDPALQKLNLLQHAYCLDLAKFYAQLEDLFLEYNEYLDLVLRPGKEGGNLSGAYSLLCQSCDRAMVKESLLNQASDRLRESRDGLQNKLETSLGSIVGKLAGPSQRVQSMVGQDLLREIAQEGFGIHLMDDGVPSQDLPLREFPSPRKLTRKAFLAFLSEHLSSKVTLQEEPDQEFYSSLVPSAVISCSADNPFMGTSEQKRMDFCCIPPDPIEFSAGLDLGGVVDDVLNHCTDFQTVEVNLWRTFRVEWEAEFLPKKTLLPAGPNGARFSPEEIEDSYQLDEQQADLVKRPNLESTSYSPVGDTYYGHAYVDNSLVTQFLGNLQQAIVKKTDVGANQLLKTFIDKISNGSLLGFTLSGFNDQMVQRSDGLGIFPSIPNGFANHRSFSSKLQNLFNRHRDSISFFVPNHGSRFNPLRNGALRVTRIRFVDAMGRERIVVPDRVVAPIAQTIQGRPNYVSLSPRLVGPAGIRLQLGPPALQRGPSAKQVPPVIGWIVPLYINQSLEFHNPSGEHIGSIDSRGSFTSSPFGLSDPGEVPSRPDGQLGNVIAWFCSQAEQKGFIAQVIQGFQDNLQHIEPELYANPSLLESLASAPIAISKLTFGITLPCGPIKELNQQFRNGPQAKEPDNGLQKIRFPVLLGDINQYNDGMIGYWHDRTEGQGIESSDLYLSLPSADGPNVGGLKFVSDLLSSAERGPEKLQEKLEIDLEKNRDVLAISPIFSKKRLQGLLAGGRILTDGLPSGHPELKGEAHSELIAKAILQGKAAKDLKGAIDQNGLAVVLKGFNEWLNPRVRHRVEQKLGRTNQSGDDSALLNLFNEIKGEGRAMRRHTFLKYFTEGGNHLWDTFCKMGFIQEGKAPEMRGLSNRRLDKGCFLTLEQPERSMIVLMHPRGKVFLKSGILPQCSQVLPYEEIKHALKKIELTLLASPVLVPKEQMELNLSKDPRFRWSWIRLDKPIPGQPISKTNRPVLWRVPQDLSIRLKASDGEIKLLLGEMGLIGEEPFYGHQEGLYFVDAQKMEQLKAKPDRDAAEEKALSWLEINCIQFLPPSLNRPTQGELQLVEGWISLKPTI